MKHVSTLITHPIVNEWDYMDVINLSDKEKLVNHNYVGSDHSIFNQNVTSPLCQKIVNEYLPENIA